MKTVFVVGATGDVGQGIVEALLDAGHAVVAAARGADRLAALKDRLAGKGPLATVAGAADDEAKAEALLQAMIAAGGRPHAAATALGSHEWDRPRRVLDLDEAAWARLCHDNLFPHLNVLKAFLPALPEGGSFVGINGGLPDHVFQGMGHLSMVQAAQRAMFQAAALEAADRGVHVRVLGLYSMIAGQRSRARAEPDWITAEAVGAKVEALIFRPDEFEGPVQTIKSQRYA